MICLGSISELTSCPEIHHPLFILAEHDRTCLVHALHRKDMLDVRDVEEASQPSRSPVVSGNRCNDGLHWK
jgi:hypothetical protein